MTVGQLLVNIVSMLEIGDCTLKNDNVVIKPYINRRSMLTREDQALIQAVQQTYGKSVQQGLQWHDVITLEQERWLGETLHHVFLAITSTDPTYFQDVEAQLVDVLNSHLHLDRDLRSQRP